MKQSESIPRRHRPGRISLEHLRIRIAARELVQAEAQAWRAERGWLLHRIDDRRADRAPIVADRLDMLPAAVDLRTQLASVAGDAQ